MCESRRQLPAGQKHQTQRQKKSKQQISHEGARAQPGMFPHYNYVLTAETIGVFADFALVIVVVVAFVIVQQIGPAEMRQKTRIWSQAMSFLIAHCVVLEIFRQSRYGDWLLSVNQSKSA